MMMGLSMIVYTFQNSLTIVLSKINKFNIIYTKTNYFKNNNHRLPMHMFSFSINSKTLLLTIISLLTVLQMCSCKKTITPYLLEDEYFDRIFKISDDSTMKQYYLHLYCKQKNVLSVSINQALEFQEHPRFSIHPTWRETPKMQKKIYTFFESCNIDFQVNLHSLSSEEDFIIDIKRKGTSVSVFKIKNFDFKAKDHIVLETIDNSIKWGLGERFQKKFHIADGTWTVWNRDRPWEIDGGNSFRSGQTYGHQPIYLAKQKQQNSGFHLIYLKNTNGFVFESQQSSLKMKYSLTGGPVHFLLFTGDHPQQVLTQYHNYIGNAHIPPFWSFGYHQSRWGYKSIQEVKSVIEQFDSNGLPIDIIWSDLDYMNKKAIFTVDKMMYPPEQVRALLVEKNLHYVPLIDVGVSIADQIAMDKGKQMNVYFKSPSTNRNNRRDRGSQYMAKVWPGLVHFVDYLHPNATDFWESQLDRLYQEIPFSGVWLDMNEPSNFQGNQFVEQSFRIQQSQSINMMTIDVNLLHYSVSTPYTTKNPLTHREVHAYYGHLSTIPTHSFLKKHGRPFIISRSNSVGSGAYAGHWTGDNVATWEFLRLSISGNFLFQIFGIHMVGADICGFRGNTNQKLCSRWMQVGSMYPFSRNHNENQSISQQPYRFGPILIQTTKLSYLQRYALLKQMYSTLVNKNGTGSFYRPIIFQFPSDTEAYSSEYVETQFMIGNYLLGAPIVQQNQEQRKVYFPGTETEFWYYLEFDKQEIFNPGSSIQYFFGGSSEVIENMLPSPPPIFLRGGKMILVNKPRTRTKYLDSNYTLVAGLTTSKQAQGDFLHIIDFNNENAISHCVQKGCKLQLNLFQVESSGSTKKLTLKWKNVGSEFIYENEKEKFLIERVIIFERNKIYRSKNALVINLNKGSGSVDINVEI